MDREKLISAMKKRACSISTLCDVIHVSKATFYRKLNGTSEFSVREVQAIVDFLGIKSPMGIFFAEKVS